MKTLTVKMHFLSGLHIGEPGIGVENVSEYIPSDTLFSALCNAWRALYGKSSLEELLNRFLSGDVPFKISSAFLFYNDKLFVPRPFLPLPAGSIKGGRLREEVKGLKMLSVELYSKWINGNKFTDEDFAELHLDKLIIEDAFAEYVRPSVVIDRETSQSNIFYRGEIRFKEGAGLYFFVDCEDDFSENLVNVLDHLKDVGIGGERSQGLGVFSFEVIEEKPILEPEGDEQSYCILSLYNPSAYDAEFLNKESLYGYEIVSRGGWASSVDFSQAKRLLTTRFIKEGAVVVGFKPRGRLINVNPDGEQPHAVYKNGIAYTVKISRRALEHKEAEC